MPNSTKTAVMTSARKQAFPATRLARSRSPCPRLLDSRAFAPTPVPMPTATISICSGKARVSAFSAASPFSFMLDTKALSTMLYTACSTMESTMGMPMDSISRLTGMTSILSGCFTCSIVFLLSFF